MRLLRSGRTRLDAGSSRRGSRQSGPRTRPRPSQRGLDGRRRARPPARRLVPLEVLRPAQRDPPRRPPPRPAQARDLHEPLRRLARGRGALLQGAARLDCRRARRRRSGGGQAAGQAGGRARRPQRPKSVKQGLGSADFLRTRVGVGRPGRGDRRPVADYVLSPFAPEDDADALVARAADAVETLARDGLEEAQRRFN